MAVWRYVRQLNFPNALFAGMYKRNSSREYTIYRPHPNECPDDLFGPIPNDGESLSNVRIAKDGEKVIGGYRIRKLEPTHYELTDLVVRPEYRRNGLGRWLLAHVVGVVESAGCRTLEIRTSCARRFFLEFGFVEFEDKCRLYYNLIPD